MNKKNDDVLKVQSTRFSKAEERANYISHGIGAVLGLVGLVAMLATLSSAGNIWNIVAILVYGLSLVILFSSSFLNHWLPSGKAKEFFFSFDQMAIYFLIAGTYTPIVVIGFGDTQGWIYLGIEWGLFLVGVLFKIFQKHNYEGSVDIFSIISYVIMGWLIIVDIPYAISHLSLEGFLWVIGGGIAYTVGTFFFKMTKVPFHHLAWHLFVLIGAGMHFGVIWFYVIH